MILKRKMYDKLLTLKNELNGKKAYLRESVGETAYGLMGAIKKVFDPDGILNPGKVCHDI